MHFFYHNKYCYYIDQAKIFTHPSNVTKIKGEDVTLYCNATGNPVPLISWTKDGSPITLNTRITLSKDNNFLKIANVNKADRGEYRCVAENSLGNNTSYPATLEVQCKKIVFSKN